MRYAILLAPILVATAMPASGEPATRPTTRVVVPTARAREAAWFRRNIVDAYKKDGRRDPRWDDKAVAFLEQAARWRAVGRRSGDMDRSLLTSAEAADRFPQFDPLVRFLHVQVYQEHVERGPYGHDAERILQNALELPKTRHAPLFRAEAVAAMLIWAARFNEADAPKQIERSEADLATLMADVFRDPDVPGQDVARLCHTIERSYAIVKGDRKIGWDLLEKAAAAGALPADRVRTLKGLFLVDYAWDARGYGPADSVTPDGWKEMASRLADARVELTKAFEADPSNALPAVGMVQVALGEGAPRAEMERWYQRAITADPGNVDASVYKLNYLAPKWHGSPAEEIAFGRECAKAGHFETGQPFILSSAYVEIGNMLRGRKDEQGRTFYERPEVWNDLKDLYEPYLKSHPDSLFRRAEYVGWAYRCGHRDIALREFPLVAGRVLYGSINDDEIRDLETTLRANPAPAAK